ncbi:MAG: hypothetical protein JXA74_12005, partial [Anaerolineae bacterium]|nr:hypothetical protein [Anaerolineae bacterium]
PDPNAPVIAPFTLEVVRGDAEALRQVYAPPTESQPIALGGHAATRDVEQITDEISQIRYVVQHPNAPDLWLVFTDSISGFPDRLPDNEATVAVFEEILQTLRFN